MDDEAGIACISCGGRSLTGSRIECGSECDRFVSETSAGIWLRWNQNRERCGALLPTLGRAGGHKRREIAERKLDGAKRSRRGRGSIAWQAYGWIGNHQFRGRRFETERNRERRNTWRACAAKCGGSNHRAANGKSKQEATGSDNSWRFHEEGFCGFTLELSETTSPESADRLRRRQE
jgi:hypothetical protein